MGKAFLDWIRSFKWAYSLFNLFHYARLKHNLPHYRRLGIRKFYFSPVSGADFAHLPEIQRKAAAVADPDLARLQDQFEASGFCVLPGFFSPDQIETVNQEIDRLVRSGKKAFAHRHKLMFAIHHSDYIRELGQSPRLQRILDALLGDEAVLFQSINFDYGSEQATHSDSIHMSTYPLGGLIAIWVALEDVGAEQGPLHYYPGSHRLPYYRNEDYGNAGTAFRLGNKGYAAYEAFIAEKIQEAGFSKETFLAKKGDVLIWHANLFHGGNPHRNLSQTRKSMVMHYFARNAVCYHELTQRPALMGW